MSSVRTAVIPAAGYGTRFLPVTKSVPKEMFPLGRMPIIHHVVQECVAAGIERIVLVVSDQKMAVEHFFTPNLAFERLYIELGKLEKVKEIKKIEQMADFIFVAENPPYGNGGAVLSAESVVENEPFIVVWGDELFLTPEGKDTRVKQCLDAFDRHGKPVISAIEIKQEKELSNYGIARVTDVEGDDSVKEILEIVEKPEPGKAPSNLATHGAYVVPPEIYDYLRKVPNGKDDELWLVDGLNVMREEVGLLAAMIKDAKYLDCGTPLSYARSYIEFVMQDPEFSDDLREFMIEKCKL